MSARRKLTLKDKLEIVIAQARCPVCGEKLGSLSGLDFDHELALVRGGTDSNENIRAIHRQPCHANKTFGPGGEKRITTRGSDVGEPAHERDVTDAEQEFRRRLLIKEPGLPPPRKGTIAGRPFPKAKREIKRTAAEIARMRGDA